MINDLWLMNLDSNNITDLSEFCHPISVLPESSINLYLITPH